MLQRKGYACPVTQKHILTSRCRHLLHTGTPLPSPSGVVTHAVRAALTVVRVCLHCHVQLEAVFVGTAAVRLAAAQGGANWPKQICNRMPSNSLVATANAHACLPSEGVQHGAPSGLRDAGKGPCRRVGQILALAHAKRWAVGGGVAA